MAMRRIAIIDHNEHDLIIEDINEKELEEKYGGEELTLRNKIERYIDDNYDLETYSWDWITDSYYIPEGESHPTKLKI